MKRFIYKNGEFICNGKAFVMGIVNVTPDSFSDGGLYFSPEKAAERAFELERQGADIIDFGAMSTRPGSEYVSPQEEIKRLEPVLNMVSGKLRTAISVDTVYHETAEFSLCHGAGIINDVSGCFSEDMAGIVRKYSAGWIVTHTGHVPSGTVLSYPNGVVKSVKDFFEEMINKCRDYGIDNEHICFDPGFGFAKTAADNISLLANVRELICKDVPFMTALSRKRFIGEIIGESDPVERLSGTIAADLIAVMSGSDFLRVHDVKETVQSLKIYNTIMEERK